MPLIVKSPQTQPDLLRLVWTNNAGVLQLIRPGTGVELEARTSSVIRDIVWQSADAIYVLFENREVKVIDPENFAVKETIEGFCSCIAVSNKGTLIGGGLRGLAIRAACFLGTSEDHVLAYADGHLEVVSASGKVVVQPENSGRGEWESFIADDPDQNSIVVAQTSLSDQQGFSDVSIRHLSYEGTILNRTSARMAGPAATAISPSGTLIYEARGLVEIRTGRVLHPAEGYPFTGMVTSTSDDNITRIFGIRSDNSLSFLVVR